MERLIALINDPTPAFSALIAVGLTVVALVILYIANRKQPMSTRALVYGALCIGIAFVLSYIRLYKMPQGGSITLVSMLPILLFAYIFGIGPGLMAGLVYGLLQFFQDGGVFHPLSILFDYILAFMALGLAGLSKKHFLLGAVFGVLGRFLMHYLSGVLVYGQYAPEGVHVLWYSLVYNISYLGPDFLLCLLAASFGQIKQFIYQLKQRALHP